MVTNNFLTSGDVCRMCQISPSVLNYLNEKKILVPKRKLPTTKKRLYLYSDVQAYIESITTPKVEPENKGIETVKEMIAIMNRFR